MLERIQAGLLRLLQYISCFCVPGSSFLLSSRPQFAAFIPLLLLLTLFLSNILDAWTAPIGVYSLGASLLVIHLGSWFAGLLLRGKNGRGSKRIAVAGFLISYLVCIVVGFQFDRHLFPIRIYSVAATSMLPTLLPGDIVFVDTSKTDVTKSNVIVFEHPSINGMHMIKRVGQKQSDMIEVLGDNPGSSIDSRIFGKIQSESLIGEANLLLRELKIRKIPSKPTRQNLLSD